MVAELQTAGGSAESDEAVLTQAPSTDIWGVFWRSDHG